MSKARLQSDYSIDENDNVFDAIPFKQRRRSSSNSTSMHNEDFYIETLECNVQLLEKENDEVTVTSDGGTAFSSSDDHQRQRSSMHSVDLDIEDPESNIESNGKEKQEEKDEDNNVVATLQSRHVRNKKQYTIILSFLVILMLTWCIVIGSQLAPKQQTDNNSRTDDVRSSNTSFSNTTISDDDVTKQSNSQQFNITINKSDPPTMLDTKTNNHPLLQSGESSLQNVISDKWETTNDIAANVTQN
jgi:hypothetical protein